jgi:hypothetical protein
MVCGCVPDIWKWIRNLPEQRSGGSYTLQICSSSPPTTTNQYLKLVIGRQSDTRPRSLSFSICAEFRDSISLWSSNYSRMRPASTTDHFLHDIICGVLQYGTDLTLLLLLLYGTHPAASVKWRRVRRRALWR